MEAVIFVGVQASGKTTFYKEQLFRSHVRISLDLLNGGGLQPVVKYPPPQMRAASLTVAQSGPRSFLGSKI